MSLKYPILDWERNIRGDIDCFIEESMLELSTEITINCFSRRGFPIPESCFIEFIRKISGDGFIVVETAVDWAGKNHMSAISHLYDSETGKIVAKAHGMYRLL